MITDAAVLDEVKIERASAVEVRPGDEILIEIAGILDLDDVTRIADHFKARFGDEVGVTVLMGGNKFKVARPIRG